MVNGVTQLVMSKADVLSNFDEIKVAKAYIINGEETTDMPGDLSQVENVVYDTFVSWSDIRGIDSIDQIPIELAIYYQKIEDYLGVPVKIISTGPDREELIVLSLISLSF